MTLDQKARIVNSVLLLPDQCNSLGLTFMLWRPRVQRGKPSTLAENRNALELTAHGARQPRVVCTRRSTGNVHRDVYHRPVHVRKFAAR